MESSRGRKKAEEGATKTDTDQLPRQYREKRKRKRSPEPAEPEDALVSPWLASVPDIAFTSMNQRLHHEISAFVDFVQQTAQERIARDNLLAVLQRTFRSRLPNGEIKVHGSAVTGLSLPGADVDLVMVTRDEISAPEKKRALSLISLTLKTARLSTDVVFNARARVPIVKFKTLPEFGSLNVDIGVNNTDGLRAVDMVKGYMSTMPALRPLVLVVKAFLAQRGLNNPAHGGLGSYAVICMCISFLQLNPSQRPAEYITKPMVNESLGALLADFLFYYGLHFPYATSYISVTLGKLLPKESAEWINNKTPNALAIQCLVDPTNDVGKATNQIEAVRKAFKDAYATMLRLSEEDESVLAPLIALKQSMVDERAHIHALVNSGRLSRGTTHFSSSFARASAPKQHPRSRQVGTGTEQKRANWNSKTWHESETKERARTSSTATVEAGGSSRRARALPSREHTDVPYDLALGAGSLLRREEDKQGNNRSGGKNGDRQGGVALKDDHGSSRKIQSSAVQAVKRKGSCTSSGMRADNIPSGVPTAPRNFVRVGSDDDRFDPEWPPRGTGTGRDGRKRTRRRRDKEGLPVDGGRGKRRRVGGG